MMRFLLLGAGPRSSTSGWCFWCRVLTGEAGRCTDRLDRQYKKWMHQSIVQYTSHCCLGCWRLAAFLGRLPGGFNRVWWTPGLGATPESWLRLRAVARLRVELLPSSHCRWCASSCSELALACPRLVGVPGVVCWRAKRGVAQIG